ncbi:NAD(P)/FAD-dependent oxidoreductase [uncultured Lactobacillus sp.]|uniref:NAD(P)/FAD-dependent oxidoreductase n=1 Tax=uncultured Lactobacillus sp. TaxID=153152 RepID=UPI00262479DE|nr:NAD(P)/FAD-dependent oxidoreductase [uncultured Lactobacillus sp.]
MSMFDLAIIGAGPVGLFATQFANLHNLKTATFEALDSAGGQVQMLFPNKNIQDIPTYSSIKGNQLVKKLKDNISEPVIVNNKIQMIEKKNDYFLLNNTYKAKTVLLTTGLGAFHPKKLPAKFDNEHIHYFMPDAQIYQNKIATVLGGGDSALDWAIELAQYCKEVNLIHRRNEFRGLESNLKTLQTLKNVKILTPYLPKDINVVDNLIQLQLKGVGNNDSSMIETNDIFVAYGYKSDNRLLKKWGLTLNQEGILVDRSMATNISGIYAAGDNVSYPGRVPMIALGFGEAQIAISNIMAKLFPEKKITLHSTSI